MKRMQWVDVAKGICILLVCIGHSAVMKNHYCAAWIYSFHMPFFFMIAGFCFSPEKYPQYTTYLIRKIKVLAYPYVMLSIAGGLIGWLLIASNNASLSISMLHTVYPYPGNYMIGFWFIRVLFFVEIVFAIFSGCGRDFWALFCALVAFIEFPATWSFEIKAFFGASIFYYIGWRLRDFRINDKGSLLLPGAITLLLVHLAMLVIFGFPVYHCGDAQLNPVLYVSIAVIGSSALVCIAMLIAKISVLEKALAWLGRYSILLLTMHPICGMARASWLKAFAWMPIWLSYILELGCIALFMWLLSGPLKFFMRFPDYKRADK